MGHPGQGLRAVDLSGASRRRPVPHNQPLGHGTAGPTRRRAQDCVPWSRRPRVQPPGAAHLARRTPLPVMVAGGPRRGGAVTDRRVLSLGRPRRRRGRSPRRSSASNPAPTPTGWPARLASGSSTAGSQRTSPSGSTTRRRSAGADAFRSATTSTIWARVRGPRSRLTAEGHGRSRSTSCPGSRATIPRRPRRRAGSSCRATSRSLTPTTRPA